MEVSTQIYDPVNPIAVKEPPISIDTVIVGAQSRSGQHGEYKISYLFRKFDISRRFLSSSAVA